MFKALFLDLDETLCDTARANLKARDFLAASVSHLFVEDIHAGSFADAYLKGIYKNFDDEMKAIFLPITNEENFRNKLIAYLLQKYAVKEKVSESKISQLRVQFDDYRLHHFDFFSGVRELIFELRQKYKLVVITNGPVYSQHPKLERVGIKSMVDHVIVGGEEPEEKPHASIFMKGCSLSGVEPASAMHVGDSLSADIVGAKNAGLKAVWISPNLEKNPLPDHIIANFTDLPQILKQY